MNHTHTPNNIKTKLWLYRSIMHSSLNKTNLLLHIALHPPQFVLHMLSKIKISKTIPLLLIIVYSIWVTPKLNIPPQLFPN